MIEIISWYLRFTHLRFNIWASVLDLPINDAQCNFEAIILNELNRFPSVPYLQTGCIRFISDMNHSVYKILNRGLNNNFNCPWRQIIKLVLFVDVTSRILLLSLCMTVSVFLYILNYFALVVLPLLDWNWVEDWWFDIFKLFGSADVKQWGCLSLSCSADSLLRKRCVFWWWVLMLLVRLQSCTSSSLERSSLLFQLLVSAFCYRPFLLFLVENRKVQ